MTCRTTPTGRLSTSLFRQRYDLPDSALTSLYHQLRRAWQGMSPHAREPWQGAGGRIGYNTQLLAAERIIEEDGSNWRGGVQRRMRERVAEARQSTPGSPAELWAFCEMGRAAQHADATLQRAYDTVAHTHNVGVEQVRAEFNRLTGEYSRAQHGHHSTPPLTELLSGFYEPDVDHAHVLPNDPATRRAVDILLNGTRCGQCGRFTGRHDTHMCPTTNSASASSASVNTDDDASCGVCGSANSTLGHPCVLNMDTFQELYDAARANITAGRPVPTDVALENVPGGVTGGLAAPGGMTFGLEIEIDFPNDPYPYQARQTFAQRLFEAGVTMSPHVERWRYVGDARDNRTEQYRHGSGDWVCEFDRSVDSVDGARGVEIKSQILHDTPETWANLRKVLSVSEELGGQATARTGLHVNIGAQHIPVGSVTEPLNLLRTAAAYDDLLVRLGNNPQSGAEHRGRTYCQPVLGGYAQRQTVDDALRGYRTDALHRQMFNLTHLTPRGERQQSHDARVEGRGFDGVATEADVGRVQAAVALHCAIVHGSGQGVDPQHPESPMGTQRRQFGRRRLSGEEWEQSTSPFRSLAGYLNRTVPAAPPLLMQQLTHMFAESRWQRSS